MTLARGTVSNYEGKDNFVMWPGNSDAASDKISKIIKCFNKSKQYFS